MAPGPADLPALLDHWVAAGIITPEQAARMRADPGPAREPPLMVLPTPPDKEHQQASFAIEALGYLGSVLVVVASVLLASQYWDELSTVGHLIVVGAAAATLLSAGFAVPERLGPPGLRMHAVLWLGATVATAGFLGLFGDEVLGWHDEDLALLVSAGAMIGPGMTMPADGGIVLALATVAALVALAVLARDLLVLGLGAWGALQVLPTAINEWFPGELTAAVVLLVVGGLLIAAAIWIARRGAGRPAAESAGRHAYGVIPARAAMLASAGVAVAVTVLVLVLGLT